MHFKLLLSVCLLPIFVFTSLAQVKPVLTIDRASHDYGKVESASSLLSEFLIRNTGNTTLFLLRADASKKCSLRVNTKKLMPGDTTTLWVTYQPQEAGAFNETIQLYSNADNEPFALTIKGNLKNLEKVNDPLTACYSFKTKRKLSPTQPIVMSSNTKPDSLRNKAPAIAPPKTISPPAPGKRDSIPVLVAKEGELPANEYKIDR